MTTEQSKASRRRPIPGAPGPQHEKERKDQQQRRRQRQHQKDRDSMGPAAVDAASPPRIPVFPPTFLPFLRNSSTSATGLTFESLLAYWSCQRQPPRDPTSQIDPTSRISFSLALDRALRRDWTTARSLLLNGAFLEQAFKCGGVREMASTCGDPTDKRDRRKLFGIYYRAVADAETDEGIMRYLVGRMSRSELGRVMKRHACGGDEVGLVLGGKGGDSGSDSTSSDSSSASSSSSSSRKRPAAAPDSPPAASLPHQASPELEPEESAPSRQDAAAALKPPKPSGDTGAPNAKDGAPITVVIRDVTASDTDVEATRSFVIDPTQKIRSVFATYARRRGVTLRSLRFTMPIQCDVACVKDAENLTPHRLGVTGRVEVMCVPAAASSSAALAPPGGVAVQGTKEEDDDEKFAAGRACKWQQEADTLAAAEEEPRTPKASNAAFFGTPPVTSPILLTTPRPRQAVTPERTGYGSPSGRQQQKRSAVDSLGKPHKRNRLEKTTPTPTPTTTASPLTPPSVPVTPITPTMMTPRFQPESPDQSKFETPVTAAATGASHLYGDYMCYPKSCLKTPKFSTPRYGSQFLPSPTIGPAPARPAQSPTSHRRKVSVVDPAVDRTLFYEEEDDERNNYGSPSPPPPQDAAAKPKPNRRRPLRMMDDLGDDDNDRKRDGTFASSSSDNNLSFLSEIASAIKDRVAPSS